MKRTLLASSAAVLLFGTGAVSAAPQDPYLFSRPAHATMPDPSAAISADMDDDGRQDLVFAVGYGTATTSYGVAVMRGTAKGFAPATFSPLPADALDVAARDLDGDGFTDVVASGSVGEGLRVAHVLPGTGGGLLGESFETPMPAYRALALGRFRPGRTGAVIATETGLEYWEAAGYTFGLDRTVSTDTATELLAADLDGDGVDELVAADTDRVTLYRDFAKVGSAALGEVVGLTAADVTGDGRPEALATSGAGDVKAYDASLAVVRSMTPSSAAFTATAGDLDGDGKADLVRANDSPSVTVAFGNGTRKEVPIAQVAVAVFVRDATGDGSADILAVEPYSSVVEVVEGDGEGGFTPQRGTTFTNPAGWTAHSADFNNDGKLDVIAGQLNYILDGYATASTASVLLNNGQGGFTRAGTISTQGSSTGLDVGDVNGDGKTDVLVSDYHSGTVSQYLGNGNGTFGDRVYLPGCPLNDAVVTGNFNGDAYADAAAACRTTIFQETVAIYLGSPAGLTPGVKLGVAHANAPYGLRVGDINGDAKQDVLIDANQYFEPCLPPCTDIISSSYDGPTSYFLGLGNGVFEPESRDYVVGRQVANTWLADVTGDGRDDILASVYGDDQVQVAPGKADGTLGTPFMIDTLEYPLAIRTGDVTGDGKVDLVAIHGPQMVSVTPGLGGGAFGEATAYSIRAPGGEPLVRDFTGDGKLDIFVPLSNTGELLINGR